MRSGEGARLAWLKRAAMWALPLVLWAAATGWYGFDLGKYSDDWAISLRTPETDAYQWPASPFIRWNYFWRPLHLLSVYGLATALWHHDWVNHAISALAHLGVAMLLARFLGLLGIGRAAAACAACAFIAIPISIEAVLWPAALGSVVGVGWFLLMAMMFVRGVRAAAPGFVEQARSWAALAIMGFITACWHEQPAACVLALPLLGACIGAGWKRGLLATCASGAGVGAYIALFAATVPAGRRGGADTLVGIDGIGDRLLAVAGGAWKLGAGRRAQDVVLDAWEMGWASVRAGPLGLWFILIVLGVAAAWVALQARREFETRIRPPSGAKRCWLALFGLGMAVASVLPIALVASQPMQARYMYGVGAGLAIALAAGVDAGLALIASTKGRRTWIAASATLAACIGMAGAICCVGVQTQMRRRADADADQMAQLRRLVASPPQGAVFVPVAIADARLPGLRPQDPGIHGALAHPWSCWAYVHRGYGRSDISSTHMRNGPRPPITLDQRGVTYARGLCDRWGRADPAQTFVPWERVVAFGVDASGVVRLLSPQEAVGAVHGAVTDER